MFQFKLYKLRLVKLLNKIIEININKFFRLKITKISLTLCYFIHKIFKTKKINLSTN